MKYELASLTWDEAEKNAILSVLEKVRILWVKKFLNLNKISLHVTAVNTVSSQIQSLQPIY